MKGIDRRSFIKKSFMGIIGGGIMSLADFSSTQEEADADSPRIKEYRTLGRT